MDFGARDAAFVPFFGVPAATLLAPSRMARALGMMVQPVVADDAARRQGYARALPCRRGPTARATTPMADARRMNALDRGARSARCPAQYLWVHKRFKTRPPGEAGSYY